MSLAICALACNPSLANCPSVEGSRRRAPIRRLDGHRRHDAARRVIRIYRRPVPTEPCPSDESDVDPKVTSRHRNKRIVRIAPLEVCRLAASLLVVWIRRSLHHRAGRRAACDCLVGALSGIHWRDCDAYAKCDCGEHCKITTLHGQPPSIRDLQDTLSQAAHAVKHLRFVS